MVYFTPQANLGSLDMKRLTYLPLENEGSAGSISGSQAVPGARSKFQVQARLLLGSFYTASLLKATT